MTYLNGKKIITVLQKVASKDVYNNVSNPNLIINGDFKVNQRGEFSYSNEDGLIKYTVDRFKINTTHTTMVSQMSNGVSIYVEATNQYTEQRVFEYDFENKDTENLLGKTVTFSMDIKALAGTCKFRVYMDSTIVTTTNITSAGKFVFKFTVPISGTSLKLAILNDPVELAILVGYMKLELGSMATANIPRPYAEELALCQRYYQKLYLQGSALFPNSTSTAYPCIKTIQTMRNSMTIKVVQNGTVRGQGASKDVTSLTYHAYFDNMVRLFLKRTEADLVANQIYVFGTGEIEVDAEIY